MRPTRKLWLINVATVVVIAHITIPLWHFGVVLPTEPNGTPTVRWWVNGVVLIAAFVIYWFLSLATRPLEPGAAAIEDKREGLTI